MPFWECANSEWSGALLFQQPDKDEVMVCVKLANQHVIVAVRS